MLFSISSLSTCRVIKKESCVWNKRQLSRIWKHSNSLLIITSLTVGTIALRTLNFSFSFLLTEGSSWFRPNILFVDSVFVSTECIKGTSCNIFRSTFCELLCFRRRFELGCFHRKKLEPELEETSSGWRWWLFFIFDLSAAYLSSVETVLL